MIWQSTPLMTIVDRILKYGRSRRVLQCREFMIFTETLFRGRIDGYPKRGPVFLKDAGFPEDS